MLEDLAVGLSHLCVTIVDFIYSSTIKQVLFCTKHCSWSISEKWEFSWS